MNEFSKTIKLRIAATKAWRDQLVKDQKKMVNKNKKQQLQGYIDILSFWVELGNHVEKFLS